MTEDKKRVRMFAGPNGSGKSTIKASINPRIFGTYINPDEVLDFFANSYFLNQVVAVNAYFASVAADFIRHQLLGIGGSK